MKELVENEETPEFNPVSHNPYNTLESGQGIYVDSVLATLNTIAKDNAINVENIAKTMDYVFGREDSPYQLSLAKRPTGEGKPDKPTEGPWITKCIIKAIANRNEGKIPSGSEECVDGDGFFFGLPAFLATLNWEDGCEVSQITTLKDSVTMDNIMTQFKLLFNELFGIPHAINATTHDRDIETFFPVVAEDMKKVIDETTLHNTKSLNQLVKKYGLSCVMPDAFKSELAVLLMTSDFKTAIRRNILAAGDVSSRGAFIGAVYGAKEGMKVIPVEWMKQVSGIKDILKKAVKVFSADIKSIKPIDGSESMKHLVHKKNGKSVIIETQ